MEAVTEELVTLSIIRFLKSMKFDIISFDFPQSGTGMVLHPNNRLGKNEGVLIPDVIAKNSTKLLILEDKDHYDRSDVVKLRKLKTGETHSREIDKLVDEFALVSVAYGIGIPDEPKHVDRAKKEACDLDVILAVDAERNVVAVHGAL